MENERLIVRKKKPPLVRVAVGRQIEGFANLMQQLGLKTPKSLTAYNYSAISQCKIQTKSEKMFVKFGILKLSPKHR